jgi:hypothetical protein
LVGYFDSDYDGDLDRRRSLLGYVFTVRGCDVSWKAHLHITITLSTTKVEDMVAAEVDKEDLWLICLYSELCGIKSCITINCDS